MRPGDLSERSFAHKEIGYFVFCVAAAVALTWPVAITLGQGSAVRGDYFSNLWNFWWVRTTLLEGLSSPYFTDYLHYPLGVSLSRHTLSPVNSIPGGVLSALFDSHTAFNLLLLAHFALSAWTMFLLARSLSGSTAGALLAGLVYSFGPYHYRYVAQLNVATMEVLPLAVFFVLRTYRDGGARNVLGTALCAGLLAASAAYYLVYAVLVTMLLALAGKLWDPRVPVRSGLARLALAGPPAALCVAVAAWPLVSSLFTGTAESGESIALQATRKNDLLGYLWIGPPERSYISWPTMLGYGVVALLFLGARGVVRRPFWLLVGVFFFVLGLGTTLQVAGAETGIGLPFGALQHVPVFSMLRKPDRSFVMVLFATALACAFAWGELERWPGGLARRRAVWLTVVALFCLERAGVPFGRFDVPVPQYLAALAKDESIHTLVHLPPAPRRPTEGRYNFLQTFHEKKIPQGYVTSLALSARHRRQAVSWEGAYRVLAQGDVSRLVKMVRDNGIDIVVLHKTEPRERPALPFDATTVWAPFFLVRRDFMESAQTGRTVDAPMPPAEIEARAAALRRAFGAPLYEDERILVYRS